MPPEIRSLRAPLLRWYRRHKRDLPWRRTRDPYAIWVSEAMLQQTTVAAVIPYWDRFLTRYPRVEDLARASEEDVLALWTGLGYYRRARALREGAIAVMESHGGRVPKERDALLALPGIGPYTAGAIASVAYGLPEPIVDGNVKRVFARLFAMRSEGAAAEKRYWKIAGHLVDGPAPGDLNQALMELGATVCTPRSPDCERCPLARACRAHKSGKQETFPKARPRRAITDVELVLAWVESGGRILLERRRAGSPLRGTWDLPVRSPLRGRTIARFEHTILSRRFTIDVVRARTIRSSPGSRWVALADLASVATSAATLKAVAAVQAASSTSSSGSKGRVKRYDFPSMSGTAPKATSSPAQ